MARRGAFLLALLGLAGALAAAAASAPKPPKLGAATVVGDRVDLTFTGALRPRVGAWTVLVNGQPVTVGARFTGRRVQLRLPTAVYSDDVVRVVGRNLRSARGARLRIVDTKPANRSGPGCSEQLGTVADGRWTEGPTDEKTFLAANHFRFFGVRITFQGAPVFSSNPLSLATLDTLVRDLSYGRSSLSFTNYGAVIQMPKPRSAYPDSGDWSARRALFADLIANLDPVVDFRQYDAIMVTTDSTIEPMVMAPVGQGIPADGKELRHFLVASTTLLLSTSLFQLAGLPRTSFSGVGVWDVMSGFAGPPRVTAPAAGLLAWHRRKLGWLGPHEVRCLRNVPLEVVLAPTWRGGGVKALIAPTGKTTALVLENRQLQGHDAQRCSRGILPYRVDTNGGIGILHRPAVCDGPGPHDAAVGQSIRVTGFPGEPLTFEVLAIEADGSYRLRVSR